MLTIHEAQRRTELFLTGQMLEALRAGQLGGVALDVHYQEKVADDDPLLGFANVILTPRMAGSPRHNGLNDFEELITGLAREVK